MITEITQEQIDSYIASALHYPVRDTEQLTSMAMLHFPSLKEKDARYIVAMSLLKLAIRRD